MNHPTRKVSGNKQANQRNNNDNNNSSSKKKKQNNNNKRETYHDKRQSSKLDNHNVEQDIDIDDGPETTNDENHGSSGNQKPCANRGIRTRTNLEDHSDSITTYLFPGFRCRSCGYDGNCKSKRYKQPHEEQEQQQHQQKQVIKNLLTSDAAAVWWSNNNHSSHGTKTRRNCHNTRTLVLAEEAEGSEDAAEQQQQQQQLVLQPQARDCDQMRHCYNQIEYWNNRYYQIQQQNHHRQILYRLQQYPEHAGMIWNSLPESEQWQFDIVLTTITYCSPNTLPRALQWSSCPTHTGVLGHGLFEQLAPIHFLSNPELIITYLNRPDNNESAMGAIKAIGTTTSQGIHGESTSSMDSMLTSLLEQAAATGATAIKEEVDDRNCSLHHNQDEKEDVDHPTQQQHESHSRQQPSRRFQQQKRQSQAQQAPPRRQIQLPFDEVLSHPDRVYRALQKWPFLTLIQLLQSPHHRYNVLENPATTAFYLQSLLPCPSSSCCSSLFFTSSSSASTCPARMQCIQFLLNHAKTSITAGDSNQNNHRHNHSTDRHSRKQTSHTHKNNIATKNNDIPKSNGHNSTAASAKSHPRHDASLPMHSSSSSCCLLRNDATTMLSVFQTMAWTTNDMTPEFLGSQLQSNAALALQIAETALVIPGNFLRCFAKSTKVRCHSVPVVLEVVQRNGQNLLHTGSGLRRYVRLIQAACQQDPTAFQHVLAGSNNNNNNNNTNHTRKENNPSAPKTIKEQLSRNAPFILQLFQLACEKANANASLQVLLPLCHSSLFQRQPSVHKHDSNSNKSSNYNGEDKASFTTSSEDYNRQVCLHAARLGWQVLPECWHDDEEFWYEAIELHASKYDYCFSITDLPPKYQVFHDDEEEEENPNNDGNQKKNKNTHRSRDSDVGTIRRDGGGGELALMCLNQAAQKCAFLMEPQEIPYLFQMYPNLLQNEMTAEKCFFPLLLYCKYLLSPSAAAVAATSATGRPETTSATPMTTRIRTQAEFVVWALELLPRHVFGNKPIMLQALAIDPLCALEWMDESLLYDYDMMQAAIELYGPATLEYIPPDMQMNHVDLVVQAINAMIAPTTTPTRSRSKTDAAGPTQRSNLLNDVNNTHGTGRGTYNGGARARGLPTPRSSGSGGVSSSSNASPASVVVGTPSLGALYHWIPAELWHHKQVALAWISVGGTYLHNEFSPHFDSDADIFLAAAEAAKARHPPPAHYKSSTTSSSSFWTGNANSEESQQNPLRNNQTHFQNNHTNQNNSINWCGDVVFASASLLSDRNFMKQAVRVNGHVLHEGKRAMAPSSGGGGGDGERPLLLHRDIELAMIALASTPNLLESHDCQTPEGRDFDFIWSLSNYVRRRLSEYNDSFMQFVLGVMLAKDSNNNNNNESPNNDRQEQEENQQANSWNGDTHQNATKNKNNKSSNKNRKKSNSTTNTTKSRSNARQKVPPPPSPPDNKNQHWKNQMTVPSTTNNNDNKMMNHLGMLRVGKETTVALQRLIAQYAGIPMGEELQLLRQALVQLEAYGF